MDGIDFVNLGVREGRSKTNKTKIYSNVHILMGRIYSNVPGVGEDWINKDLEWDGEDVF